MADISKIKLPNGVEYNVKDTTARAQSGVTGVKGVQESSYRTGNVSLNANHIGAAYNFNEVLNAFSPEKDKGYAVKIDRLENAFYFADKRWIVTGTKTAADGTTSQLTASQLSWLFDMTEENAQNVPAGGTLVVLMDFSNGTADGVFPNYPYGDVCMQFYPNKNPVSVSARVYGRHTGTEYYWSNLNPYEDSRNTGYANRYIIPQRGMYNMQKLEITITAPEDSPASVSEIAYYLTRGDKSKNMPYVSKLRAETLYYDLTAPKFIGSLEGNVTGNVSGTASNVTGTVAVSHGGTGATTAANAANVIFGGLPAWTADPTDDTYLPRQDTGGAAAYGKVKFSTVWNYIFNKIKSIVLSTSTSSTSTTTAATSSAVKTAYDLANTANSTANTALSGVNGNLIYDHTFTISNGVATFTPHVYQKGVEVTTNYATSCFSWKYRLINGTEVSLTTKSDRGCDVTISSMGYGGHVIGIFTPS